MQILSPKLGKLGLGISNELPDDAHTMTGPFQSWHLLDTIGWDNPLKPILPDGDPR